jgi:4-diphosphocytidyl-2-C-methyl-D-erythritol kinase
MRVLAPAKVNLSLRITGRRADGYHLLDSLMIPVSLCDEIEIEAERSEGYSSITLTCDNPALPTDEKNLAYKAATALLKETSTSAQVTIRLQKRIPAGAGLGGGSSDAAAVLKSLNTLLALQWSEERLCTLAAQLGADVPFFIPCRPARVAGIGELLTPVDSFPERWFVLVIPPFSVSTPWAYHRFDELPFRYPQALTIASKESHWLSPAHCINDLERAVIPKYPLIRQIKERLLQLGAECALMSGSGSSVFGVFQQCETAEHVQKTLGETGQTFLIEPFKAAILNK